MPPKSTGQGAPVDVDVFLPPGLVWVDLRRVVFAGEASESHVGARLQLVEVSATLRTGVFRDQPGLCLEITLGIGADQSGIRCMRRHKYLCTIILTLF